MKTKKTKQPTLIDVIREYQQKTAQEREEFIKAKQAKITKADYAETLRRVVSVVSKIGIDDLISNVELDTEFKTNTATWFYNLKTKQYKILLNYWFVQELEEDELDLVIEHELLHHLRYRRCDVHNNLMDNIVLDTAINKTLYLYKNDVMSRLSQKVYESIDETKLKNPGILACPNLTADQIESIPDEKLREAYIDVWGSRKTLQDFNEKIPIPLNLYYKLSDFLDPDADYSSEFSLEIDAEGQGEGDEQEQDEKDGKENDKQKNGKKKIRVRFKIEESEEDKPEDGKSDDSKEQKEEKNKKEDSKENDGEKSDEDKNDENESSGYAEFIDKIESLDESIQEKIADNGWKCGKESSPISFAQSKPAQIDAGEVSRLIKQRAFEQTIDEIADVVNSSVEDSIMRQVYPNKPTRTTLTYMACGITKHLPFYYNHRPGEGKPKIGCYVDVSGSMDRHSKLVQATMTRISEHLPSVCFLFDTSVMPFPTEAWNKVSASGGGTHFDSVLRHTLMTKDEKNQWLKEWMKLYVNGNSRPRKSLWDSGPSNSAIDLVRTYGINEMIANEDYPVILMATDGECNIDESLKKKFIESKKTLLVLLLVDGDHRITSHPFGDIAKSIYFINSQARIVDRINR